MEIKPNFKTEKAVRSEEIKLGEWGMHGDVVIKRIETLPNDFNNFKKESNDCLAYGEATGHAHKLFGDPNSFDVRIDPVNPSQRYLRVVEPIALRHQEHKEIIIFPGDYQTYIQREYDPFEKRIREVAD